MDLNADMGESFGRWQLGDDRALLRVVTSANIACGFHAGDPLTLRHTCQIAADRGVAIGAQVGYRDLAGFGRRYIDVASDDLIADVLYQIGALDALARVAGSRVRYVKPHGALYHATIADNCQAEAVVRAVAAYDSTLAVLGFPDSALLAYARDAGLPTVTEAFADRRYNDDGSLVDRRVPGAVLEDTEQIVAQALSLARANRAASICLHGDTPGAVASAVAVRAALAKDGIAISSFVSDDVG